MAHIHQTCVLSFGTCKNPECEFIHFYIHAGGEKGADGKLSLQEAKQLRDQLQMAIGEREMGVQESERKSS